QRGQAPHARIHVVEPFARIAPARHVPADDEVLLDGHVAQHLATFHDVDEPAPHDRLGIATFDGLTLEPDAAARDTAVLADDQVRDGLQRGALARTIGAEQRHAGTPRHARRDPLDRENDVAVEDLDVVQLEQRGVRRRRTRPCMGRIRLRNHHFVTFGTGTFSATIRYCPFSMLPIFTLNPSTGNGASSEYFRSGSTPKLCSLGIGCVSSALRTSSPVMRLPPASFTAFSMLRTATKAWLMPI